MKRPFSSVLASLAFMLFALAGCGGGGGGGSKNPSNPFAGTYQGNFQRPADSVLFVAVDPDGSASAVVSDANGIVVEGSGTATKEGAITVQMTGPGGNTSLTGTFSRAAGLEADLDGGVQGSNIQLNKTNSGKDSAFSGKYKILCSGATESTFKITISKDRQVYIQSGGSQRKIGAIGKDGKVTFEGQGFVDPGSKKIEWQGTFFATPSAIHGSGSYKETDNLSFAGAWSAVPDAPQEPLFTQVSYMPSLDRFAPNLFGASPNGHTVGWSGDKAVYYASPDSQPIILQPYGGTTIAMPVGVNSSGAVVGASYNKNQYGSSLPVIWNTASAGATLLPLPEDYVSGAASDINDSGIIVGLVRKANGETDACIWPSAGGQPILPEQGDAVRVSNAGVVLCQANNGFLPNISAERMSPLGDATGFGDVAIKGMGKNGIIVGSGVVGTGARRGLAWYPLDYYSQTLVFLPDFTEMIPFDAGSDGAFVGRGQLKNETGYKAVYWKTAGQAFLVNDIVANNSINFEVGLYVFADGSILVYGREPTGASSNVWLRP